MSTKTLETVISTFGHAVSRKLSNPAISGAPEDQLRGPLEVLILDGIADLLGYPPDAVTLIGETSLAETMTRPDYAVTFGKALTGFIEVKAPGKGADPRRFQGHDKEQWTRLRSLPNLLYTDGISFSLWRDGELQGQIVRLEGDLEAAGKAVRAPGTLLALFSDFFTWTPQAPKNPRRLAEVSARLCRLLRDEVSEELARGNVALSGLAQDWRKLLFPQADDGQFADGYAQAVTFGLLIARTRDIPLGQGIEHAASDLKKSNSLIGTALGLLTDNPENRMALKTSLDTMARVLDAVDWPAVGKKDPEAWLYFYEHFLEVYDNTLRKRTGSYYTPPEVVNAMVRMVDEVLRGPLFERANGLASPDVTVADPAVGTGTFLLGVLRKIADTVATDLGEGAVPSAIAAVAQRLIGFELQFGPFAVAQLRLIAEFQELMVVGEGKSATLPSLKLFITDTLGNPYVDEEWLPQVMQPIAASRKQANAIKKGQPITVVIGNPPYKEKAEGRGGWVESGAGGKLVALMDWWRPPVEWGVSAHTKHLKNLYVYFWRWATWKVFGSGNYAATGTPDRDEEGIVCFITVAGFLNGPGFQKMREDLRRTCSRIWVIDCSPEGHQPEVATRIFQGVQQPVCIVIAAKKLGKDPQVAADVRYTSVPAAHREQKFTALAGLSLESADWIECSDGWRDPFLPEASGAWADMLPLTDLFVYHGSGVMPGRTWVIAPDRESLSRRWDALIAEKDLARKEVLFHPHQGGDKTVAKTPQTELTGHRQRKLSVRDDKESVQPPTRYGFRSYDRQWIIPDTRILNRPNPTLWESYSSQQIFVTAPDDRSPSNGPALSFSDLMPDLHHYNGRGGRVMPLWRNAAATQSNIRLELLTVLADSYGQEVLPSDVMAYLAAVMAHPAFTEHFRDDLVQPGLRVPITTDAGLFFDAVALGREVIWLHCYGERFTDAAAGRPKGPPRLPAESAPRIPAGGAIPGAPEPLPDTIDYQPENRRLIIGRGYIDNVPLSVWEYEVSGKQVVKQWFSYRKLDRTRPIIGDRRPPSPLDSMQPDHWLAEYTTDLMNLLHVLGRLVALEPKQAALLKEILGKPLLSLEAAGLQTNI